MSPADSQPLPSSVPLNPSAAAVQYAQAANELKQSLQRQLTMYFDSLAHLCVSLEHRASSLEQTALAGKGNTHMQAQALKQRDLCMKTQEELSCVLSDLKCLARRLPGLRLLTCIDEYVEKSAKLIREATAKIEGLGELVEQGSWRDASTDLVLCLSSFRSQCHSMDLALPEIALARRQIQVWKEEISRLTVAAGKAREESWQFMVDDVHKRASKEKLEQECLGQISELNEAIQNLAEKYGLCV